MKRATRAGLLGVFGMLFLLAAAAQPATLPAVQQASYAVAPEGDSGVSGVVHIADYGAGYSVVVVSLTGLGATGSHPAHFHEGDCGTGGAVVLPLENVDAGTGLSVTVVGAAFETIVGGNYHLNVHRSADDMGMIIACGEVGAGTVTLAGTEAAPATPEPVTAEPATPEPATPDAQPPAAARPEEREDRIRTEGYGIFAVGGSGISGQAQVASRAEGGTRITVTLDGIDRDSRYPAEIRAGSCGPDGAVVVELEPVPFEPGETSSVTESEVGFATIAEGEHFIHVYAPDGQTVVACGEVGLGANR